MTSRQRHRSAPPPQLNQPAVLRLSFGHGRRAAHADRVASIEPTPQALAEALRRQDGTDAWWSPHVWKDLRRRGEWLGSGLLAVDIDYHDEAGDHAPAPDAPIDRLGRAVEALPGSLFHRTPRGFRLVFLMRETLRDAALFRTALRGACDLVGRALANSGVAAQSKSKGRTQAPCGGYAVDRAPKDLARFFWAPNAVVNGVARKAEIHVLREQPYDVADLAARTETVQQGTPSTPQDNARIETEFARAVARWNTEHRQDWGRPGSGTCPACAHHECFGQLDDNPDRWSCFSASHAADSGGCGIEGSGCWHGDALDIEMHRRRSSRQAVLVDDGYLIGASGSREPDGHNGFRLKRLGRRRIEIAITPAGKVIYRDTVDPSSAPSREQFVKRLRLATPAVDDALVERIIAAIVQSCHDDVGGDDERVTQADLLVGLVSERCTLFHASGGNDGFAVVRIEQHDEVHALRSEAFRLWITREYYTQEQKAPNSDALASAINTLVSVALFDGAEEPVFVRVADHGGFLWFDLCDAQWRAVRIGPDGWQVVSNPPVRFIRKPGMLPAAEPQRGGSLDELRCFANVNEVHWRFVVAWLLAALRFGLPVPVLVVNGEQGTSKSTLCRLLRLIIDPNKAPLRRPPRDERDLSIAARNSAIIALENLSSLPIWLSDALCALATGGGLGTRKLYTDDEEEIFDALRPILLNGIVDVVVRSDLADRSLKVTTLQIPESKRLPEAELMRRFADCAPRILGALLDVMVAALRHLPDIKVAALPRMADFARLIVAAEPALGWEEGSFLRMYAGARAESSAATLEAEPIGAPLLEFLHSRPEWVGTAKQLLDALGPHRPLELHQREWPNTPKALSDRLRRLAPDLRSVGVHVHLPGAKHRPRHIRISVATKLDAASQAPSELSAAAPADGRTDGGRRSDEQPSARAAARRADRDGPDDPDGQLQEFSGRVETPK